MVRLLSLLFVAALLTTATVGCRAEVEETHGNIGSAR